MAKHQKKSKKGRAAKDAPVGTGGVKKAMSAIQKRNAKMRKLAGLD